MIRHLVLLAAATVALGACTSDRPTSPRRVTRPDELLAVQSGGAAGSDGLWIYTLGDSVRRRRAVPAPLNGGDGSWSPDGERLAVFAKVDGDTNIFAGDIYAIGADGSGLLRLTTYPASGGNPVWSPDGTRIAFGSYRDGNSEVYVMRADGTEQTRLTFSDEIDGGASWSADGSRIIFDSYRDGNSEVYSVRTDGTGLVNLTNNPATDFGAHVQPNGTRLVFSSRRSGPTEQYVMNLDGSGLLSLGRGLRGEWSPTGSYVTFESSRTGDTEIYAVYPDNLAAGLRRLTNSAGDDEQARPSPDGRMVAFVSNRNRSYRDLYVMRFDGSNVRRLTNGASTLPIAWRPRPATRR